MSADPFDVYTLKPPSMAGAIAGSAAFQVTLFGMCFLDAGFVLVASAARMEGPGSAALFVGFVISCALSPALAIIGLVSAIVAGRAKKSQKLLWLATALAAGASVFLVVGLRLAH